MKKNATFRLLLGSLLCTACAIESALAHPGTTQESPASVQVGPVATAGLGSGNTVKQAAAQEYAAKNAKGEETAGSFVKDYLQGKLQLGSEYRSLHSLCRDRSRLF